MQLEKSDEQQHANEQQILIDEQQHTTDNIQ